jgi:hypothetical protein
VRAFWRESSKRLGLSFIKQQRHGVDLVKPFREVGADLQHLISVMSADVGTRPDIQERAKFAAGASDEGETEAPEKSGETLEPEAEGVRADDQASRAKTRSETRSEAAFRKTGAVWQLSFEGKTVHIPDRLGLGYIADLLRTPQVAIEAAQLAGVSVESSKLMPMPGIPLSNEVTIKAVRAELATFPLKIRYASSLFSWERCVASC